MKLIYKGKSKDVFDIGDGNYLFQFKDDVTGTDGIIDPGANEVIGQVDGLGRENLRLTEYFYRLLNSKGIPTHFVSADINKKQMVVRPATLFGKGVEVIVRLRATGSFIRRFGDYIKDGDNLDYFVETTLKDDRRGDPFITKEIHEVLGILKSEEYETLVSLAKQITKIVSVELAKKRLELWDIKYEFARVDGKIMLVDEISGGCMRAFKDGKPVPALDIADILLRK
ncbi:MAG: phosphoribosylaminoimidazolesuccinocarboxamide synthase [Firmicutes bacterium]|nr:phosphoribosylaminoimidazolesuccinocarboxamide synthase [Bacillota bacterium]